MNIITTHISDETAELLKQFAKQKSVSEKHIVKEAIEDYLEACGNYDEALRRLQDVNEKSYTIDEAKDKLGFQSHS